MRYKKRKPVVRINDDQLVSTPAASQTGLRSLAERKQSNLFSVNSNESKVNLIQECKR